MKIDSVLLENFGLFGGRRYRFDGQPLVLIYGANESGKTTTLNGLRQALFGFPHNSAYITGKPMSAEVSVTLSDGRLVRFTRQKKRNDAFKATVDGKFPLSEAEWLELAGGLDLKSYQSLFGFSLDELRNGEKALAHAPLDEALSGSGLGGLARLQHVQHRIDDFLSASLKRVGTGGAINAKLAEIEAAEKQLESVLTLPSDVAELRQRITVAQETVQRLGDEVRQLRAAAEASKRRQAALPRAIEYRQVEQSLQTHELPAGIDESFRLQWTVTNNKLAGARNELVSEERKRAQLESSLAALPEAASSGEHHAETSRLGAEAQQVAQRRRQLAEDVRECEELERELGEALRRLGWSRQDDQWRRIELDLAQRAELDGLRQQAENLAAKLAACQTRLEMAASQLDKHAPSTEPSALPENLPRLETLIRQAQQAEQNCLQHARQREQFQADGRAASDAQRLLKATQALQPASSDAVTELDANWHVPAAEDVAAHRQSIARLTAQHERLASELQQRTGEMESIRRDLAEAKSAHGLMSLEELESVWQQRDAIVGQWRQELTTPLLEVSAKEQDERLAQLEQLHVQSDATVRSMLKSLDRVAAMIAKQQRLSVLETQLAALTTQVSQSQAALDETQAAWRALWKKCPFVPDAPERMASWLESYRTWRTQRAAHDRMSAQAAELGATRDAALDALRDAWPAPRPESLSIAEAEKSVGEWRAAAAMRAAEQKLIAEIEAAHRTATAQLQQTQAQYHDCLNQYAHALSALQLPPGWPIQEIGARLEALTRCQATAGRIHKIRERMASLESQLERFAEAVRAHAQLLGETRAGASSESLAAAWLEELNRHEAIVEQRTHLAAALAAHVQTVERRQSQVQELEQGLTQLALAVGAESREQVQEWIRGASTVFQLRTRKNELKAALEASAAGQPLDEFLAELTAVQPASITAASASLTAQLTGAEASLQQAVQQLGSLMRELEYREQGSAALECEQRLKQLRSELVELSEQWVVHRMAGELLARTIDRFTRDHEPQLLKHTRRFFRELTDDRYCVVEHDSGKHGGFAVRDQHGHAWQPDKLSTGTREQLYLAIRLAFITYFNEQREPLPVIMDDCFVNFDDTRARIALRTLIHWQESVQTILLSCHWRSVEALAELAPETPVIAVATGETTTARQLASQADALA